MTEAADFERMCEDLVQGLLTTLDSLPGGQARLVRGKDDNPRQRINADAVIDLVLPHAQFLLIVEAKRSVFPRDARETLWQLRSMAGDPGAGQGALPLLAAETVSAGARELLRGEGIGYFDSGGSLYLPAPGAFVLIERPQLNRPKRQAEAVFVGRRGLALQGVWTLGDKWFKVDEVAHLASVSVGTASETLAAAERRDWLSSRGAGPGKERRLSDRRGLLDAWTEHELSTRRRHTPRRFYIPEAGVDEIARRLDQACGDLSMSYCLTGEAALQLYAPYLSSVTKVQCRMVTGSASELVLREIDAQPVEEGWNLAVTSADRGEFAFRERLDDVWIASPLRTYLDLLHSGGRARAAADHLREQRLDPR